MRGWKIGFAFLAGWTVAALIGYGVFVAVGARGSFFSLKGLGLTITGTLFLLVCLLRAFFQADDLLAGKIGQPGSVIGSTLRGGSAPSSARRDEPPWRADFDDRPDRGQHGVPR